jgi:hypothetical protein
MVSRARRRNMSAGRPARRGLLAMPASAAWTVRQMESYAAPPRVLRITGDLVSHQRRHLSGLLFGLRHPPWIRAGELVCADRRENRHEESEPRGQ